MVAVAVHQVAILVYHLDQSLHKEERLEAWTTPIEYDGDIPLKIIGPFPTLFFTSFYDHPEQYPDGVADVVGYWAENRILGGVVLFYRGQDESQVLQP
jgi:hypothetical protein